ncbi:MAG: O-antigen ligase family protein [Pirellulaceae bacterium]|nr:O-antigen ligase family protein [Pirellulaceae bacterium]
MSELSRSYTSLPQCELSTQVLPMGGLADEASDVDAEIGADDFAVVENRRWSRSIGLWLVSIYIVLFLIRPWEILVPSLGAWHFERMYAVVMISVVLMTGRMPRWNLQTVSVIAFALAVTLSALNAWQSALAWHWLYQYLAIVLVYFLMLAVCRAPRDLFLLIMTYVGTMFVYLTKSLWEFYVHGRHEYAQSVTRLLGIEETYGEPNSLAMSVVLSLPLWLFLLRSRKPLTWQWSAGWRWGYGVVISSYPFLAIVTVWETNSRAGMLGIVAFLVGAVAFSERSVKPMRAVFVCMMAVAILWLITPAIQKERLSTLWDKNAGPANAHASASGRWEGFLAAMQMVQDRPLLGVGIGNFRDYRIIYVDGIGLVAHNLPGQILGETGVLGGTAFLVMILATLRMTRRLRLLAAEQSASAFEVYVHLAQMCLLGLGLSILFGVSLHNGLRFNWLWIAAFSGLALQFCEQSIADCDDAGQLGQTL